MDGPKMQGAVTMALHLGDAIETADAPLGIVGFADIDYGTPNSLCNLHVFKTFNQTMRQAENCIASADCPYGTPLSPAIIATAKWLRASVTADRYLLGVLTDGACNHGPDAVQMALRVAAGMGVEPFGLGAEYDLSHSFRGFPNVEIHDVTDLPKTAMRMLLAQFGTLD
jgi:hypothetical protein